MFEKVNKFHPDKVADRIAGALVDIAYTRSEGGWAKSNPRIAVEVLIGHGFGTVIVETDADLRDSDVTETLQRIAGIQPEYASVHIVPQDAHLADNQRDGLRCGDNGIFKGCPVTDEQRLLTALAKTITENFPSDGKYVLSEELRVKSEEFDTVPQLIVCQSNARKNDIFQCIGDFCNVNEGCAIGRLTLDRITINPLGEWTGGTDTDAGATNRKLGSDMGDAVTGGGLHGKDLSKADVSVNIVCHLLAQEHRQTVTAECAIGDESVTFHFPGTGETFPDITMTYRDIVERARLYILTQHGSFEHFAEWGLIA